MHPTPALCATSVAQPFSKHHLNNSVPTAMPLALGKQNTLLQSHAAERHYPYFLLYSSYTRTIPHRQGKTPCIMGPQSIYPPEPPQPSAPQKHPPPGPYRRSCRAGTFRGKSFNIFRYIDPTYVSKPPQKLSLAPFSSSTTRIRPFRPPKTKFSRVIGPSCTPKTPFHPNSRFQLH